MRLKYQYDFIDKLDSLETNLSVKITPILLIQKTIKLYSNLEKSVKVTLGSKFFLEVLAGQKSINKKNQVQRITGSLFFNVTVRGKKNFILFENLLHTTYFLRTLMFNLDRWNITNLDFFMDNEFLNKLSLLQILSSSKITIF
uniref:Uncharacterized protein n=1 Tax=Gracilariopsis andersonii TaxID=172979 RepID=E5Q3C2_9FLOR|nr:hypothetical protein GAND_2 [Gracilariopsis andersonii]ADR03205.1 hypothetical protein GAND_2 [Gracilariopsis andersonii]APC24912.1 hypothetical protein [Gracilariopsis andersonii]